MTYDEVVNNLTQHAEALSEIDKRLSEIESRLSRSLPALLAGEAIRSMPYDLAEVVEQAKLTIIRHNADHWNCISRETTAGVFRALADMAEGYSDG